MVITQDTLVKDISDREDINVNTVKQVLKSAENVIFDYLLSAPPSDDVKIKLFSGISLTRKYIEYKIYGKGMFDNISCGEHVRVVGKITRHFNNKINRNLFL